MALSRKRAEALFQKIQESDEKIKNIRGSFRSRSSKRRLISEVVAQRRKGSTKKERLIVRLGNLDRSARQRTMDSIRKVKNGFNVRLGGPVRGKTVRFRSRAAAVRAANKHHNDFLKNRLGSKGFGRFRKIFQTK